MTYEQAKKDIGLMGPKGNRAKGYLDGFSGKDPSLDESSYEEGWMAGAEDSSRMPLESLSKTG